MWIYILRPQTRRLGGLQKRRSDNEFALMYDVYVKHFQLGTLFLRKYSNNFWRGKMHDSQTLAECSVHHSRLLPSYCTATIEIKKTGKINTILNTIANSTSTGISSLKRHRKYLFIIYIFINLLFMLYATNLT